jgi:hypothetical protein
MVSNKQDRMVQIYVPRSTAHSEFRTPLAFRSLSKGGGGPRSGAHLSDGPDERARINGDEEPFQTPPTFLPLSGGGGGSESYVQLPTARDHSSPDQRRLCSPAPLSCPVLNQCGPSSCRFILPSAFPLLPCVIHSPLLGGPAWLSLLPSSTHRLPRVLLPFHISPSPEGEFVLPSFPIYLGVFRHGSSPVAPLCHHSHSLPLLPHAPPRCHHSYHTPWPRWPRLSLKLFSYSRWQREKSSLSQDAELAWPLSIPRSSY